MFANLLSFKLCGTTRKTLQDEAVLVDRARGNGISLPIIPSRIRDAETTPPPENFIYLFFSRKRFCFFGLHSKFLQLIFQKHIILNILLASSQRMLQVPKLKRNTISHQAKFLSYQIISLVAHCWVFSLKMPSAQTEKSVLEDSVIYFPFSFLTPT